MNVGHSHEIRGYGGLVGLFEAGVRERAGNEEARRRVRWWRRLMGMKRSSIVSWRSELISGKLVFVSFDVCVLQLAYRDGGSCLLLPCALLIGSYALMSSAGVLAWK